MKNLLSEPAVEEIVSALGRKDMRMRQHPERVAVIAQMIAAAMKLGDEEVRPCALGGLLHEVGELDVPNSILFKPAKLNADEVRIMRTYPYLGYEGVRFVAVACAFDTFVSDRFAVILTRGSPHQSSQSGTCRLPAHDAQPLNLSWRHYFDR
jgi:HD-GYP domain-containing protein (c-di-GMP phosphodiesterase class II)